MKQAIIKMANGDYQDVIQLFNAKRWFTWISINNILPHPDIARDVFLVHNNKFLSVNKERLHSYFVSMLACNIMQKYQTFFEVSISKMTYKYRKGLNISPYGTSPTTYKGILISYNHNINANNIHDVITSTCAKIHTASWSTSIYNAQEFTKFCPWVIDINDINLWSHSNYVRTISSLDKDIQENDYIEMLTNALDAVGNLWFIDSEYTNINWELIKFKIKPYKLLLWIYQWTKVELQMPGIYVWFKPSNKSYNIPEKWSCCHPHVSSSGSICLWDFSSYINTNRKDIQWALINIYDLLCTYNTNSPYWRPNLENYNHTWRHAPRAIMDSCVDINSWVIINWEYVSSYEDFKRSDNWGTYWCLFD